MSLMRVHQMIKCVYFVTHVYCQSEKEPNYYNFIIFKSFITMCGTTNHVFFYALDIFP